mmetsp:Transcript_9541/g.31135  ORF Transcript_9541/g.31135 Transcript_9541/m.31135 type:complete len:327 (-) Transcript_9541:591-1571(-)
MNWSIMHCAVFAKSPNCASHMISDAGFSSAYPSSKPSTPNSEREELHAMKAAWPGSMLLSAQYLVPHSFWSWMTQCRCEKVPRSTSWPEMRTWFPSLSKLAHASCSPIAQSKPLPSSHIFARCVYTFLMLRCGVKPSGSLEMARPSSSSVSFSTPVSRSGASDEGGSMPFQLFASQSSLSILKLRDASSFSCSVAITSADFESASACERSPLDTHSAAYSAKVPTLFLMAVYICGCVNIGSSISLWPCFRYPTMSITTSFLKVWRHSAASRQTRTTASTSSPLTWKMGACTAFATSVQYGVERDMRGSVVKPIWLLVTMWMVPPVV